MCTILYVTPLARKYWSGHAWITSIGDRIGSFPPLSVARAAGRVHGMPGPRQIVKRNADYLDRLYCSSLSNCGFHADLSHLYSGVNIATPTLLWDYTA
jgi:hypothetical protein